MYEYNWVYTIAQIELMNIDAPITCYKKRKRAEGEKPTQKEMGETVERWKERKKKRKWKMQDLLRKGKMESDNQNNNTHKANNSDEHK